MIKIGKVYSSSTTMIETRLDSMESFEENKSQIRVGKYLLVESGNIDLLLVVIQNLSTLQLSDQNINYSLNVLPIGTFRKNENDKYVFIQGVVNVPSPTEPVYIPEPELIKSVFETSDNYNFELGLLNSNDDIPFYANGNKLFSKHLAVVGSTGSGKSCSVSRILQQIIGIENGRFINKEKVNNSHIIIFDIHSEYSSAFKLSNDENLIVNKLDVEKLSLPYWLMNSQELEALFIESNEMNSHNQISQFKKAVILSKEKHNSSHPRVTYDTPVYFDIKEVYNYISNKNNEIISKLKDDNLKPKKADGTLILDPDKDYLNSVIQFASSSTSKEDKASNGPYNGDFERFISRLDTKLNDKRLDFIMSSKKTDGTLYTTTNFEHLLKQFIGYLDKSNVTIVDLSGVPFEVLSIVISLLARIIFDFAFNYTKIKHLENNSNDIPYLLVCEEAHNYIPRSGGAEYNASKTSIERIAKEGRKYGLSLMVVSQRPSEVSETILSQCNNFIVLKLTNINDQSFIKKLLPDNNAVLVDNLPTLKAGQCLIVGDSVLLPAIVQMKLPNPQPNSNDIKFYDEWSKEWVSAVFTSAINRWRKD